MVNTAQMVAAGGMVRTWRDEVAFWVISVMDGGVFINRVMRRLHITQCVQSDDAFNMWIHPTLAASKTPKHTGILTVISIVAVVSEQDPI